MRSQLGRIIEVYALKAYDVQGPKWRCRYKPMGKNSTCMLTCSTESLRQRMRYGCIVIVTMPFDDAKALKLLKDLGTYEA